MGNLIPIKKGEQRALKPQEQHRRKRLVVKVTAGELAKVEQMVSDEKAKNKSDLVRGRLGF